MNCRNRVRGHGPPPTPNALRTAEGIVRSTGRVPMPEPLARTLLGLLAIHALVGLVFAATFLPRRIERLDPSAEGASWAFRLWILPGVVALWPLLWARLRSAR